MSSKLTSEQPDPQDSEGEHSTDQRTSSETLDERPSVVVSVEVEAAHVLPPPYVVKPYNEGSSVGVYIVG